MFTWPCTKQRLRFEVALSKYLVVALIASHPSSQFPHRIVSFHSRLHPPPTTTTPILHGPAVISSSLQQLYLAFVHRSFTTTQSSVSLDISHPSPFRRPSPLLAFWQRDLHSSTKTTFAQPQPFSVRVLLVACPLLAISYCNSQHCLSTRPPQWTRE